MAKKPDPRTKKKAPRRTRMIALEPRMLFDGALGIDLGVKASAALQGEALAATDATAAPAAPQRQDTSYSASAVGAATEKTAVEKTAERLGIAPEPPVRNEVVFVDSTMQGHEALIAGLNADAKVVLLDPTRDALDQIADYMDGERAVDAIHVFSHGGAGNLILAGQTYSADRLAQEYATDLARIGHALSADGDILLYGCDVGQGSAGARFIDTLSAITGADIAASVDKTGAADLGGDWLLEVKTGQVETVSISLTHEWDFLLTAPPVNVGGATLDFDGANRTLESGVAGAVGAVYKYSDVATISGTQIDAYVTITGITNATLVNIDNDAPAGYVPPGGTTAVNVFAPEINVTGANGKIDFAISFKDPNGNDLTLLNFYNNSLDIDSAGGFQQFVEYGGFKSVTTSNATDLVVSASPGTDGLRFTGTSAYGGLIVNDAGRVQANFDAISTLQISMGATGATGVQQYGSLFSAVSFGSAVTVTAPTSDLSTTADTTPILTGSVGTAALGGGESFAVTVNGTTYTTANGLGISGTTWSLELPTALASGQYDVRAVRSSGGLDIADQTQLELTINDAPTLADTALTLAVAEDAPAPAGAVGSLVSSFTGGVSDANAGAVKGIAITGTNETNGTWYYTTNGGTTWTAVNAIDGTVSGSNALLLADNASTRLYFRPNADYNGSAPAALTLRAWDTTSGTAGTKVDPGAGGGSKAFSTASDTVDVTVTAVADAPVNTVPAWVQGTPINTSLEFSSTNGNLLSVNDGDGNLATVRVTVTNGVAIVTLAGAAAITAGANNSATLTLSGTQADINATLNGLRYTPTTGFTGAATLTLLSTDGAAQTDTDVVNITVAAAANVPRIDLDAGSTNETVADNLTSGGYAGSSGGLNLWTTDWFEDDPEGAAQSPTAGDVQITAGEIVLGDPGTDDGPTAATRASIARGVDLRDHMNASLSFNYDRANLEPPDQMVVEVSTNGGASYTTLQTYAGNTAAGVKTISLAGYESESTVIRFRLNTDFAANENVQIDNVVITAQPTGFANTFTEGGAGVAIAQTDSAITDPNGGNLAGATIRIADNYQSGADVLQYTTTSGITGVWDATTGTLTLTGTTTAANYQNAIEAIRFNNTSDAPSTATRTITAVVRDTTGAQSNTARATVTVVGVNDAPVGVNDSATAIEAGGVANATPGLNPTGNVLANDTDVDPGDTKTVSAITGGTVGVAKAGAYGSLVLNADGSYTYALDNANAAVEALRSAASELFDTFTYTVRDTTGATSTATLTITIQGANDTATIGTPSVAVVTEDVGVSGGNLSATGSIAITDVDDHGAIFSTTVVPVGSPLGALVLAADGTYTYTVSNAALQSLGAGQTVVDTFTVTSAEGTTQNVSFTINGANDAPVNTVPGAQSVNEDTALSIAGVSVNDVEGNLSTTSLTVANGTVMVSLAGGATISAGANGSSTLTLSGTQAQINAALASISYQGNADFNGTDTLTVLSTDANGATDSDAVAITVTSVNDGPVNTVPAAQTVNEDTALSIAGVSVNDVDGNLASTQLTVTNGMLNVSLAGGATISAGANSSSTLTLSGTQAQINAALASLSYQGNAEFNGADTLTVLSTDANGATDSDAVAITVTSVNDGPVNTVPGAQTVIEDTVLSIAGMSVNDVDGNLASTQLTVTNGALSVSLAGGATISAGANGSSTLTLSGTQAQINAALASLSYQGNADFNGGDSLTVLSTDANGATDSDAVAITVNSVNDGPVNTVPGAQSVNEDTALSIGGISVSDVDGNLATTQLTVTNGALSVSLAGGATISAGANGSSTLTLSGTQAQINAALASLSYQGNADFNGADSLTVLSTDANGATDSDAVTITVSSVNDGPVNSVPGAQAVNEDTSLSIAGISVNDVDGNLATTQLSVTNGALNVSLAGGATISAGTNGSSTLTLSGTQAQINAALASISYQGNADFNGADTVTVLSTDANGATDSDSVAITVSSVNDGPVNTVPGAQSVNEDTALSIVGVSANDVDGNLSSTQLAVTNGALNVSLAGGATISAGADGSSTLTLSGTQAQINAALASLSYQGNADFNGGDTLTVLSTDTNGATDSDAVAITVTSINDGPVNTVPGAQAVNEDTALSIGGISVNDVDANLSSTQLTVTNGALNVSLAGGATISAGANGSSTLTLSGTQAQINAALASLSYQGNANFNGADMLTVLSADSNGATDSDSVAITVTSVNDGPVNTVPGAQSVNEDTALSIGGISVNDVDGNLSTTQLTVTNGVLNVSLAGGASIGAGANGGSTLTLSGTQAQINAALASLSYQGNADFNGGDTLTVLSTDANGVTDSDAVAITVTSVNDGPVNSVPGAQAVNEDAALSIVGISVNDVDGNLATTQLSVTNGALNVSLAGGATISAGANGASTLTLSGTQAQLNAALASLSYQGNAEFNGGDTLTVLSTDANGATDSDAVAITVSSVNDGPVNSVPGAQTVNEDTSLSIAGISVNDVDGNLATTQLSVTNGALNVSLAGGATISAGANGSSTLTLSGTQAQINAALASLSYQANAEFNGADTLTVLSTDANGATDSDSVAITVSSVNDAPVNTVPGARTVNEDAVLIFTGANTISVIDVDGNLTTTQLSVTNGTLNVSLAGASISAGANGSSTLTLSGTLAQINAALASVVYQGSADFNGGETLTVLSTDANGATDSDAVAITVTAVNDGPVNTVPGAQTVNEDAALSIAGVSVNDVDGNLATTQLSVSNGVVNVGLAGGASISAGANGSSTLTLSGTQAQINAALATLAYQGNANFSGADGLTVLSTDTNGASDSDSVAITVNAVNDGPVNSVPGAQTVNEDTALSIVGVSVNDVDGNLSSTQLSVANGALNVSLAGGAAISAGANGSSTLTLSGTQAQINAALASLSYQGNAEFNGADTLTVLSTDGNGATDTDSVAITVTSVNDGPMNTVPAAQSVNEDTLLAIAGVSVNDVDGNLSTTQLTVTNGALNVSLAGGATISAGANGSTTLTLSGTQAQINAALASLSYQGNADFNGGDTLSVLSTDANGASDSDAVSITVTSVNDGPVNSVPGAQTVNEDTSLSIGGISVNDVDGNLATTQLSVANGALNVSLAGGATISAGANGSSTLTLSGTQAQINAALASLSYQGSLDFAGADTLTVLSTDANGATDSDAVAITVSSVNDGPVNTVPGAQTVNEDTSLSIVGISVNDVDGNLSTTQLSVTSGALNVSLAGGATISAGANGSSTLTLSGTQAQINAALASISYQGNADFNGADTLTVLSTDVNGATDSDAVAITVSSVNDGPLNTVPGAQTVNEDTSLSIGGISVNDVDGNLSTTQLTVTNGSLNVSLAGGATISAGANGSSSLTLSGTQAQINAALASISYQGNVDFNGADTLTVLSTDANGVTDSDAVAITVSSVNDGPLNTVPGAQSVNEDTLLSIGGISVNDVDSNLATTQLSVTNGVLNVSLAGGATVAAGANGSSTLTLSGTQAQINAALASLSYQGNAEFNGAEALTVLSTDANGATDSDSIAITVTAVNDGPVNTVPGAQSVNEDTSLSIAGISVNDVDGNLATMQVSVTNGALNVSLAGGATISAGANGSSTLTLSGTQAQINAALASLSYQGNPDFNGADTLTVLSIDANGDTDSDVVAITVTSVNDGPVNTVPGAQTVNEDTSLSIAGISVNDVDGNLAITQLSVTSGALNVSLAGGATISAGANGSSTLTLSGTQAQINAALASLAYQGNADFNGADTLTVLSADANGATDSDAVAITVSSVNDGPVNTVPGAQTVNEDTSLSIGGISVNDVDGNLSSTRLTVTNGSLNVSLASGATISSGANASSTLTLSGTHAQINAALASLSYQGSLDFSGSDTLTVLSTDANGATDSDSVSITVTSVNDGPVNSVPGAQTVNEDTLLPIAGISVNDVDGDLSTTQLAVFNGRLNVSLAGGAAISAGASGSSSLTLSGTQAQINAALSSLSYQGNANFNGADTLTVLSIDSAGATDSAAIAITVAAVNDGPVNTMPGAQTVGEGAVLPIGGISVNDVDGNLSNTQLIVTNGLLNVSLAGGATISAGANGSVTLTLSGTQAQINAALASLSYQGNPGFSGGDTLVVLSIDGNGVADADAIAITVTPIYDGPVNTVPGAQTVNEDTVLAIGGVSVNDIDGNLATARLTVSSGALTVSLAGGATISAGANGSSTLTLAGTQAQINAALASLTYQGNADFAGGDILTVVSTDANGATDSDSLAITVTAVNDAPAVTSPATATFAESTTGAVYVAARADPDAGDTVTWTLTGPDAALFSIDPITGVVTLSTAQSFAAPADANGDGIYDITVRATDGSGQFDQRNVQLTLTPASIAQPRLPSTATALPASMPAAPTAPPFEPPLQPLAPRVGEPTLGLPVDGGVAPANLAGAPVPASWSAAPAAVVASQFDLNALPPTAAGQPSTFSLTRLSQEQALAYLRADDLKAPAINGHHLFVYQGVPDLRLLADGPAMLRVPADAFAHTDPSAVVQLEARLSNGDPLPGWLRFDGLRGVFSGTPPQGAEESLEVEIVARDTEGREACTKFTLEINAMRLRAAAADVALGMDVDKEEVEKARLDAAKQVNEGRAATQAMTATAGVRPAKTGAASFSDQVSAAKTQRDPLLDRIGPSDKAKPGTRR